MDTEWMTECSAEERYNKTTKSCLLNLMLWWARRKSGQASIRISEAETQWLSVRQTIKKQYEKYQFHALLTLKQG